MRPGQITSALIAIALAVWPAAAADRPAAAVRDVADRIAHYVRPLIDAGELSGALLIGIGDTVVYEEAFGDADIELGVANTPTTRFNTASISKPITQVALVQMVEQGALAFDDPISTWLPAFPRGNEITIEHLAHHRAGIPHRVTTAADEAAPMTPAEVTARAAEHDLLFEPGSDRAYSSAGYTVLARVLELADGRPWHELIAARVLRPAGMVQTVHPRGDHLVARRAQSYFLGPDGPIASRLRHMSFLAGAGSLFTTPRDLWSLQQHLLDGGFGEEVRSTLVADDGAIRWNGISNGYRAFADHHPNTGVTVIFTGNLFTSAADLLRRDLPKIVAGEPIEPPSPPQVELAPLPSELADELTGDYRLGPGLVQPLKVEEDYARLGDWVLIPLGGERFFSPQDSAEVTVARTEDGAVAALQWGERGPRFERLEDDAMSNAE